MEVCCTEGVVLRNYPLGESDLIAVLFTRAYGRLSGVAKGARRTKSPFVGALEPLNWVEVVFFSKEGKDLVSLDKADVIQSFAQKTQSYRGLMQLSLLAELLITTTLEREPNDSLFRLLLVVLPQLTHPATADLAQAYFEIWYLKLAGLFPDHRKCQQCRGKLESSVFVDGGRFFCEPCGGKHGKGVSTEALDLLDRVGRYHLAELSRLVPTAIAVQEPHISTFFGIK